MRYFSLDRLKGMSEEESLNRSTIPIKLKSLDIFFDNEIDKANSIIIDDTFKAWVEQD